MIKKGFLLLLSTLVVVLILGLVFCPGVVSADVVSPSGLIVGLGLGLLVVLGIFVAIIALVSFLVIRGIKKRQVAENSGSSGSAGQDANR